VASQLHRCSPHHKRRDWYSASAIEEPAPPQPSHDAIAALAYRYWQERGCPIGSPEEDWYRAERALRGTAG
jgi:hypothetical protein